MTLPEAVAAIARRHRQGDITLSTARLLADDIAAAAGADVDDDEDSGPPPLI